MRLTIRVMSLLMAIFTGIFLFTGCSKDEAIQLNSSVDERGGNFSTSSQATPGGAFFYGLSMNNELISFTAGPPVKESGAVLIAGMADSEFILAIDFRPATGDLYGVSNRSLIYIIDPVSGKAAAVSPDPLYPAILGSLVGFDFEPKSDMIRLVTDNEQNLQIDPATATVVNVEFNISPTDHTFNSIAYSNSFWTSVASGSTSSLYAIDLLDGNLYKGKSMISSLKPVGSLGLAVSGEGGFDISRDNTLAYAVLYGHSIAPKNEIAANGDDLTKDNFRLYNINLRTGQAQYIELMSRPMTGLAIP